MRPEVKFCGMTREADALAAAGLGARYLGVIFAGGPRHLQADRAAAVLDAAGGSVLRVGVFAGADDPTLTMTARTVRLDVIQLHDDPTPADVASVRDRTGCQVWAVRRLSGAEVPERLDELFAAADAVLVDARVPGKLGGAGIALPWGALAPGLAAVRGGGRMVLAGGLRPENVATAITALEPDVVDVSSGVESAPGIKDVSLMQAFMQAVES